jgi:putative hydrolase of the HAD superfamily
MISKQKIRAIGFDVDGTLYNTPDAMSVAVGKILIEKVAQGLGRDIDEVAEEYLAKREQLRSNTLTINSFGLDGEALFQAVWDGIALEKYVVADQKLATIIASLKKRYRLFIISNGTGRQVERKLNHLGLNHLDFDPRIYCYDHHWAKPEPAPFLSAIESLGLKPEEVVYVGDREDVDIDGAAAVGMQTLLVGNVSASASASIESVYDIVNVL